MRTGDLHILKDYSCDLAKAVGGKRESLLGHISQGRSATAALNFPQRRHHCATILQH
jgi:hypothetical protein